MPGIQDEVLIHRKDIKYDSLTMALSELVNMYQADHQEIKIDPDFQRLFRWSREQQSNFIESLILEIPIPPLFFYETDTGVWELIDGLQRLSTILRFVHAKETAPESADIDADWHYEYENDIKKQLVLLPGEYLKEMGGYTFATLPSGLALNLKRVRLHVYVLKRETPKMYKYEVFKRLNRGGSLLNEQEIRNCSVRMLGKEFPDFLRTCAANSDFVEALGLGPERTRDGTIEELALRFFAMKNNATSFRHDVAAFLTRYMEEVASNKKPFDFKHEQQTFEKTFELLNATTSFGDIFRKNYGKKKIAGPFSPALFEMIAIGVALNLDLLENVKPEGLYQIIQECVNSSSSYLGAGSNSRLKTSGRISHGIVFIRSKLL